MKHIELFETVEGKNDAGDIKVYALSTCGFCKRALKFLRENSIQFRFLYIDDQTFETRQEIKEYIYEKFNERIRYPFLILNDTTYLVGFTKEEWASMLKIKEEQ